MANISDILNRPAEDVEAPKPLPVGSYNCVVKGLPEQGESSVKKTPYLRFSFQIVSPREDVEASDIEEFETNKTGEKTPIAGRIITSDYYLTNEALFMLTDFLEALGIDFTNGKSVSAAIDESPNMECVVFIKHEPSKDGKRFFARVGRVVSASELDEAA
jgi:hypothetical protein